MLTLILAFVLQAGQVIPLAPTPDDPVNDGPVVSDPIPARVEGEVKKPGNYLFNGRSDGWFIGARAA
jgi:hypothetical protein